MAKGSVAASGPNTEILQFDWFISGRVFPLLPTQGRHLKTPSAFAWTSTRCACLGPYFKTSVRYFTSTDLTRSINK